MALALGDSGLRAEIGVVNNVLMALSVEVAKMFEGATRDDLARLMRAYTDLTEATALVNRAWGTLNGRT